MSSEDENQLLARIAAQDRRAFEALYQRYYRRLFGYIFKVTRRAEIVEEVVNDVMFTVWQSAGRFDGRSRPSSWILGIAYRKALKAVSRLQPRLAPSDAFDDETPASEAPDRLAVHREVASVLGRALASLSPEQRAVVELTFYQGLSYREISEIMGCPINTVKTRMFHARRRLREVLPGLGYASHLG